MQDKIQEIMGLVDDFGLKSEAYSHQEVTNVELISARRIVESKLRELVREPLSDDKVVDMSFGYCPSGKIGELIDFARAIERAHGITKTSWVE